MIREDIDHDSDLQLGLAKGAACFGAQPLRYTLFVEVVGAGWHVENLAFAFEGRIAYGTLVFCFPSLTIAVEERAFINLTLTSANQHCAAMASATLEELFDLFLTQAFSPWLIL